MMNRMNYFCRQLMLVALVFSATQIVADDNGGDDSTRSISSRVITSGVSFNQQISSSSINNSVTALANGGQFLITKSGRYFLSNDVVANPMFNNIPVIFIDTSDVVIDLGGKTLSLSASSHCVGNVGIKISPGLRNVFICNGTISGANAAGVGNSFYTGIVAGDPTLTDNSVTANIILDSVIVTSCMQNGVALYNCKNIKVSSVSVQGITDLGTSRTAGATVQKAGMKLYKCSDVEVLDSDFNGVTLTSGFSAGDFAVGLNLELCRNVNCRNVTLADNKAFSAGSAIGLRIHGTVSSKFEDVRAVGNYSLSANSGDTLVAGALVEADWHTGIISSGNMFKNCCFNDNLGLATSLTSSAYGLRVTNSCHGTMLLNCVAANNQGILGCGISLYNSNNNTLRDCMANGNHSDANKAYSQGCGYRAESGTGNLFIRCEARGNTVLGSTGVGVGTTAAAIASNSPFINPSSFGFYLSNESYSGIRDSMSASNCGNPSNNHVAYGIAYFGTCSSCLVAFSEIDANKAAYQYGFKDFAAESTTLLRGNISFAHGQCFSGGQSSIPDVGHHNFLVTYTDPNGTMDVQNLIKEADIANMNAFEAGSNKWFNFSILEGAISSSTFDVA